jgi:hypothetical protein
MKADKKVVMMVVLLVAKKVVISVELLGLSLVEMMVE